MIKGTAQLRRRILAREASVAVLGQGYVGLTLACGAAEAGFGVTGIDIDVHRIEELRRGSASVPGVDPAIVRNASATGRLGFAAEPSAVALSDITFICVPTPAKDHTPDLSHVRSACRDVADRLRPGSVVVLESTSYPGTTEELVRPLLEAGGLAAGRDFLLAYSPERIDPGNGEFDLRNIPRIVGGLTPESAGVAALFYAQLVDKVLTVSSCRAAELAKLMENTFRHVNIALVNEIAMVCEEMGIDVWEVLDAAATKPFGYLRFDPGPGVGGNCIPVDPTYLAWGVRRDSGHQLRLLEQAQDVNARMPSYVAARIGDALNEAGRAVNGAEVLVLGVAYKADVGDARESPALRMMAHLLRRGARVSFHDPHVSSVTVGTRSIGSAALTERAVRGADCVVLATPHSAYDLEWIAQHARLVFDARNAYGDLRSANVVRL